jgi:DNA-binding FadR family transcriptional regulator
LTSDAELFFARRLLEVSLLPLVARSATEAQFRQMEAANDQMEADEEHLGHYQRRGVIPQAEPPETAAHGPTAVTRTERSEP